MGDFGQSQRYQRTVDKISETWAHGVRDEEGSGCWQHAQQSNKRLGGHEPCYAYPQPTGRTPWKRKNQTLNSVNLVPQNLSHPSSQSISTPRSQRLKSLRNYLQQQLLSQITLRVSRMEKQEERCVVLAPLNTRKDTKLAKQNEKAKPSSTLSAAQPSDWYNADGGKPEGEPNAANSRGSKFVRVVLQFLEALQAARAFRFRRDLWRGSQVVRPRSAKPLS